MTNPELNRGDKGEAVVRLQDDLNKVGAMLKPDGDFGSGTERGVRYAQDIAGQPVTGSAEENIRYWLDDKPEPYPLLDTNGIAFIAQEETGGLSFYQRVTRWPHYPGVQSGITIGVGYDLRFNTLDNFRELWEPHLPAEAISELAKDIGKKGTKTRASQLKQIGIEVLFKAAWPVFIEQTLPRFYEYTEGIYSSLPRLPQLCRSVLVSIVFNRGSKLTGSSRQEMRKIRDILAAADDMSLHKAKRKMILSDVEDEILSMQRLWEPSSGLIKRRQSEANLWRTGLNNW